MSLLFKKRRTDIEWLRGIKGVEITDLTSLKDKMENRKIYEITINLKTYEKIKDLFE